MVTNTNNYLLTSSDTCPLCMETLDETDKSFFPCPCGYQVCLWCLDTVRQTMQGKCPVCRQEYTEDNFRFVKLSKSLVPSSAPPSKSRKKAEIKGDKANVSLEHLKNIRILKRNLAYVLGIPNSLAKPEILKKSQYFGRYGQITNLTVTHNPFNTNSHPGSCSAYITYTNVSDASDAIRDVDSVCIENSVLRAYYGTVKYCALFLKNVKCYKKNCLYLHNIAPHADCFLRKDILTAQVQNDHMKPAPLIPCPTESPATIYRFQLQSNNAVPLFGTTLDPNIINQFYKYLKNNKISKPITFTDTKQTSKENLKTSGDVKQVQQTTEQTTTSLCDNVLKKRGSFQETLKKSDTNNKDTKLNFTSYDTGSDFKSPIGSYDEDSQNLNANKGQLKSYEAVYNNESSIDDVYFYDSETFQDVYPISSSAEMASVSPETKSMSKVDGDNSTKNNTKTNTNTKPVALDSIIGNSDQSPYPVISTDNTVKDSSLLKSLADCETKIEASATTATTNTATTATTAAPVTADANKLKNFHFIRKLIEKIEALKLELEQQTDIKIRNFCAQKNYYQAANTQRKREQVIHKILKKRIYELLTAMFDEETARIYINVVSEKILYKENDAGNDSFETELNLSTILKQIDSKLRSTKTLITNFNNNNNNNDNNNNNIIINKPSDYYNTNFLSNNCEDKLPPHEKISNVIRSKAAFKHSDDTFQFKRKLCPTFTHEIPEMFKTAFPSNSILFPQLSSVTYNNSEQVSNYCQTNNVNSCMKEIFDTQEFGETDYNQFSIQNRLNIPLDNSLDVLPDTTRNTNNYYMLNPQTPPFVPMNTNLVKKVNPIDLYTLESKTFERNSYNSNLSSQPLYPKSSDLNYSHINPQEPKMSNVYSDFQLLQNILPNANIVLKCASRSSQQGRTNW